MEHLEDVSVADLQRALDAVDGKKPTQRLTAAIAYKHGVSQTEIAEWYDVQRRTVYNWLQRLDEEPLERAVRDESRSGRPRKLTADQQARLEAVLRDPPTDVGYDATTWTPELVQRYLAETFDVTYSVPSCRRLMKEAGLRYRNPSRTAEPGSDRDDGDDTDDAGRWVPEP